MPFRGYLFTLFFLASAVACAQTPPVPVELVSIREHPGFDHFKATLKLIIDDRATDKAGTHHFYVAKYDQDSNLTYMLWQEERKLWILAPGDTDESSWLGMRYPSGGQLIDLNTDVVEEEADVGTSTYLVPEAWIHERMYDAVVNGDLITIKL